MKYWKKITNGRKNEKNEIVKRRKGRKKVCKISVILKWRKEWKKEGKKWNAKKKKWKKRENEK